MSFWNQSWKNGSGSCYNSDSLSKDAAFTYMLHRNQGVGFCSYIFYSDNENDGKATAHLCSTNTIFSEGKDEFIYTKLN